MGSATSGHIFINRVYLAAEMHPRVQHECVQCSVFGVKERGCNMADKVLYI